MTEASVSSTRARGLRRRDVVAAFIAYFSAQILVWTVAGVYAAATSPKAKSPADLVQTLSRVVPVALPVSIVAGGLALALVLRRWRKRLGSGALARVLGFSWGKASHIRNAALLGALLALIMLPLMSLAVHRPEPPDLITQLTSSSRSALWAWIISAVLLAPPVEELMFRGALLGGLGESWSVRGAAVVSGALFWLMHGPEFVHWPVAVAIGLLTILATRLRLQSGALGPSIALHFGYNLMLGSALAFALLAKPHPTRWARAHRACSGGSGGPEREDRKLGWTAEPGRDSGGAHSAGDIERSVGVAIPAFQESSCPNRLHWR
jgi:membrane protease YdiL (CAAX protease family)